MGGTGIFHRDNDLPAVIVSKNNVFLYEWYYNNVHHRGGDLPAVISEDKDSGDFYNEWYYHGELHRDNDLPAMIYKCDGLIGEAWYYHNKPHRDNNLPAKIFYDGMCEYWRHGVQYYPDF